LIRHSLRGWAALAVVLFWGATLNGDDGVVRHDWGPFFIEYEDAEGSDRVKYLGPVGDNRDQDAGNILRAVRPFYHMGYQKSGDFRRSEYLWPLGARRTRLDGAYTRILLTFYWNWDVHDNRSPWRLWVLPFYFQGRDHQGESYVALFPLIGRIHEFFFWDRIDFVMWPIWVESRINEIHARTFLWPFVSKTVGPGIRRFRIFPFYGYNELEGRGRKTTVLWPFWTHVRYTIPGSSGSGWILFPITGHLKLTDQETWWLIPPIFRYTKGEKQNRLFGPWPFFQKEKGEVDKFYLFPFYGHKSHAGVDKYIFIWPLGMSERSEKRLETREKFRFFPFLQVSNEYPNPDFPSAVGRKTYLKVWPLFQQYTEQNGKVRELAVFDFNFMRGGPIDRNWAPFWRIYTRSQHHDSVDTEVLWGMYRSVRRGSDYRYRSLFPVFSWSRESEGGHFSVLKGLVSRRREGEQIVWRWLYLFRFGDRKEEP